MLSGRGFASGFSILIWNDFIRKFLPRKSRRKTPAAQRKSICAEVMCGVRNSYGFFLYRGVGWDYMDRPCARASDPWWLRNDARHVTGRKSGVELNTTAVLRIVYVRGRLRRPLPGVGARITEGRFSCAAVRRIHFLPGSDPGWNYGVSYGFARRHVVGPIIR